MNWTPDAMDHARDRLNRSTDILRDASKRFVQVLSFGWLCGVVATIWSAIYPGLTLVIFMAVFCLAVVILAGGR